jgi:hypothetical protein
VPTAAQVIALAVFEGAPADYLPLMNEARPALLLLVEKLKHIVGYLSEEMGINSQLISGFNR